MKRLVIVGVVIALAFGFVPAKGWWQRYQAIGFVRSHNVVTGKPLSVFEWRGVQAMQAPGYAQTLTTLEREGYRTIFVSFDASAAKANEAGYAAGLNGFGALLTAHNMQLALVAGDPSWANISARPAVAGVLAFVHTYNDESAHRIQALQFDIEPYTAGASANQTAGELANVAAYVASIDKGETIGFTAPFWLAQDKNGAKQFLHTVGTLPGGFVTIMDYRRATAGSNGSIALAAPFFTLANGTHIKLIVGLDATNTSSADTFYGANNFDLRLAQYLIDKAEAGLPAYAGQAVNYAQLPAHSTRY